MSKLLSVRKRNQPCVIASLVNGAPATCPRRGFSLLVTLTLRMCSTSFALRPPGKASSNTYFHLCVHSAGQRHLNKSAGVGATVPQLKASFKQVMETLGLHTNYGSYDPDALHAVVPRSLVLEMLWQFLGDAFGRLMLRTGKLAFTKRKKTDQRVVMKSGLPAGSKKQQVSLDNINVDQFMFVAQYIVDGMGGMGCTDGYVASLEPLGSVDECVDLINDAIRNAVGHAAPKDTIYVHVAPMLMQTGGLQPTLFLAHTITRCRVLMEEIIGAAMTRMLVSHMHCTAFPSPDVETINLDVDLLIEEHMTAVARLSKVKSLAPIGNLSGIKDVVGTSRLPTAQRTPTLAELSKRTANEKVNAMKTFHLLKFTLNSRLALSRASTTLVEADETLAKIKYGDGHENDNDCIDNICSKQTLGYHAIFTDDAIDVTIKQRIEEVTLCVNRSQLVRAYLHLLLFFFFGGGEGVGLYAHVRPMRARTCAIHV